MDSTPFSPLVSTASCFDREAGAWVVTRHEEILAVLKSPVVSQAGPPTKEGKTNLADERDQLREQIMGLLARPRLSEWQRMIRFLASELLFRVPQEEPVDLVSAFFRPWCLRSALLLSEIPDGQEDFLAEQIDCLSLYDAQPDDQAAKSAAKQANNKLDLFFKERDGQAGKSVFLGVAQTVPTFLAGAFYALFQNPDEWSNLQRDLTGTATATEELLRFAGPVHTLFRHADEPFELGGCEIRKGDRLILRLDSANHDERQFDSPNRLDLGRRLTGHLSLGAGPHSCVGAALVRICTATAILALLERAPAPKLLESVEWHRGTMLLWPAKLPVVLKYSDEIVSP